MFVCICNAVTDREIRQCVDLGACCMKDLKDSLGVANCCGQCAQTAESILTTHLSSASLPAAA